MFRNKLEKPILSKKLRNINKIVKYITIKLHENM